MARWVEPCLCPRSDHFRWLSVPPTRPLIEVLVVIQLRLKLVKLAVPFIDPGVPSCCGRFSLLVWSGQAGLLSHRLRAY